LNDHDDAAPVVFATASAASPALAAPVPPAEAGPARAQRFALGLRAMCSEGLPPARQGGQRPAQLRYAAICNYLYVCAQLHPLLELLVGATEGGVIISQPGSRPKSDAEAAAAAPPPPPQPAAMKAASTSTASAAAGGADAGNAPAEAPDVEKDDDDDVARRMRPHSEALDILQKLNEIRLGAADGFAATTAAAAAAAAAAATVAAVSGAADSGAAAAAAAARAAARSAAAEKAARDVRGEHVWRHVWPRDLRPYCCNHSKFVLLFYDQLVRVIILSNNFTARDVWRKTGSLFVQDFPLKTDAELRAARGAPPPFEAALEAYFRRLYAAPASLDGGAGKKGSLQPACSDAETIFALRERLARYCFEGAKVALIVSVPGRFVGELVSDGGAADAGAGAGADVDAGGHLTAVGHLAVRREVRKLGRAVATSGTVVAQFSSLARLSEDYLAGFDKSMRGGFVGDASSVAQTAGGKRPRNALLPSPPPPPGAVQLCWPTAEFVRRSSEGWVGGTSLPSRPEARGFRPHVLARLCPFVGPAGRSEDIPHVKTFLNHISAPDLPGGVELQWVMTGSHNVSSQAWGGFDRETPFADSRDSFVVGSYEMSVLFAPDAFLRGARIEARHVREGRLPARSRFVSALAALAPDAMRSVRRVRFVPAFPAGGGAAAEGGLADGGATLIVAAPVPFELPCRAYAKEDRPWEYSSIFPGRDRFDRERGDITDKGIDVATTNVEARRKRVE
jgi:hypothetical protein